MYHLIIDTCVWIDLGSTLAEVCEKISDLVEQEKVSLILPLIVIDEWDKHKPEIIAREEQSIRGKIKNARFISQYLDQEAADEFRRILDDFQERKDEIDDLASKRIEAIEYLFSHPSTVKLAITEKAKLQAVDCALAKRAPFQSKNSMADALIVFCVTDYIIQENLANCIFVSSDTQDFASKSNKAKIHQDLKELFGRCEMRYFSNIGLAINEIEEELVSDESIKKVEEVLRFKAIQEAFLESQRQMMESIRSIAETALIPKAFLESQRQWMESIGSVAEAALIPEAFLESQRQWMESIRSIVEAALIPKAFLESQRQVMKIAKSMRDFSRMVKNTEVHRQKLNQPNQEESRHEANGDEVDSISDQQ